MSSVKVRVRGSYGGPWGKKTGSEVSPKFLQKMARCIVRIMSREARKDFARRGWSGRDPKGGPDIGKSFGYKLLGKSTIEVTCSFWGIAEMVSGDIPERRMVWLTQEAKDKSPSQYTLTDEERKRGMKATGRMSEGKRLPLVVPLKGDGGQVIFRVAPLTTQEAWIHPGIAKHTFIERAMRQAREECVQMMTQEVLGQMSGAET